MEVVRSHRQIAAAAGVGGAGGLPTYRAAPQLEVRLEEFELFAIDRLRVLKGISDGLSRGKRPEEMEKLPLADAEGAKRQAMIELLKEHGGLTYPLVQGFNASRLMSTKLFVGGGGESSLSMEQ